MPAEDRREHDRRMHRVLAHIDRHLDAPLDLVALAAVANFSPFHFHRVFSAWAGERLGDYLRRRRLETAAVRLSAQPRTTITEAALAVGFGSGEAFSRAFKEHFGESPSAWRRTRRAPVVERRNPDQANRNPDQAPLPGPRQSDVRTPYEEIAMNVTVVERPPRNVAYLRYTGPYGAGVSRFWMEQVAPWMQAHGLFGQARYGISLDDPSVTAPEQCRYDACAELPEDFVAGRGVLTTVIPGGRYACLRFEDTLDRLPDAWDALLRDWLPGSGLELDARPMFEYYPTDATYCPDTGVIGCEVCIPVARR
jgi:AraC family transcriptional regulator